MKKIIKTIFYVYIVLLFLFVVLKIYDFSSWSINIEIIKTNRAQGFWNYNIRPLKTISAYLFDSVSYEVMFNNMLGNSIPFIPMGFLLGLFLDKRYRVLKILGITFVIILLFECVQFFTCLGFFDIDDIILNVLASILGYLILKICIFFSKR